MLLICGLPDLVSVPSRRRRVPISAPTIAYKELEDTLTAAVIRMEKNVPTL